MISAISEDPASFVIAVLLAFAFAWVLYILATSEPNESAKLQYRIEHYKPEKKENVE